VLQLPPGFFWPALDKAASLLTPADAAWGGVIVGSANNRRALSTLGTRLRHPRVFLLQLPPPTNGAQYPMVVPWGLNCSC
jgi:hypothetical protein